MNAWRLPGGEVITRDRPWMDLEHQPGFGQRAKMVADAASLILALRPDITTMTDLGCGDGSLLARIPLPRDVTAWGYELGAGDVEHAQEAGLDVRQADILDGPLQYGDLLVCSEVLEHLDAPKAFLHGLPAGRLLVASSPSAETIDWHNPVHSWAWDTGGYRDLFERSGWHVLYQAECDGGLNTFAGVTGPQRFQLAVAGR